MPQKPENTKFPLINLFVYQYFVLFRILVIWWQKG